MPYATRRLAHFVLRHLRVLVLAIIAGITLLCHRSDDHDEPPAFA